MNFHKCNGQIYKVELTSKEQKALDAEINRQLLERHRQFSDDVDYMIMKILHDRFEFDLSDLRQFYDYFVEDNAALEERYEMSDAGAYVARKEMNEIGCNIEKWNQERSG
jgi:dGTP triphosphohydrolase